MHKGATATELYEAVRLVGRVLPPLSRELLDDARLRAEVPAPAA